MAASSSGAGGEVEAAPAESQRDAGAIGKEFRSKFWRSFACPRPQPLVAPQLHAS